MVTNPGGGCCERRSWVLRLSSAQWVAAASQGGGVVACWEAEWGDEVGGLT